MQALFCDCVSTCCKCLWYIQFAMSTKKDPAAVALGRRGGKAKVPKGFAKMDPKRRAEIAKKAADARWKKAKE
jgi:hypothetical protein